MNENEVGTAEEIKEEPVLNTETKVRTYKEIKCKRCGYTHSSNDRECPNCGFSVIRELLKIIIAVLIAAMVIGSITFLIIRVNKLETSVKDLTEQVEELTEVVNSGSTSSEYDITDLEYYDSQLILDGANLESLGDDYLIYALQDGCSACATANEYIYYFLYYGYPDYIPMYFVTPESANEIFYETLNCESTPTLYRMSGGEIVESAVGVDDVYTMLDNITQEAKTSEE